MAGKQRRDAGRSRHRGPLPNGYQLTLPNGYQLTLADCIEVIDVLLNQLRD
ncbi:hypothetical protein ACK3Y4_15555 [Aeromonas caviae]